MLGVSVPIGEGVDWQGLLVYVTTGPTLSPTSEDAVVVEVTGERRSRQGT